MVALKNLTGQKLAIVGLGKAGMATLAALRNSGAQLLAWDDNEAGRQAAMQAGFAANDLTGLDWSTINSLILAPGIPHKLPKPHPAAVAAAQAGVEIIGDTELLFRQQLPAKFVGITGTNGKSTTTALIGHILKKAGRDAEMGGNLGFPALAFRALDADGIYVIEMSSYMAERTPAAAFDVAVWLNITPDHLARHGDIPGYVAAKETMLRAAGKPQTLVIGVDDAPSAEVAERLAKAGHWQVLRISSQQKLPHGLSALQGKLYQDGKEVFDFSAATALPGSHNAQNVAAAYGATKALGLDDAAILASILSFPGLPHRQQRVREWHGVRFVNDSKATNADATSKALGCYENIYWILGGQSKEGGLNGLEEYMPRIRRAYLIGEAAPAFEQWLKGKAETRQCGTLHNAVLAAAQDAAREGAHDAVVLLSPACASWDQFKSYEDRGEQFMAQVRALDDAKVA